MSTDAAKSKYPPRSCDTQSDLTKDETNSFFSVRSLIRYFKKKKVQRVSFYMTKFSFHLKIQQSAQLQSSCIS